MGKKILVIEDEVDIAELIRLHLSDLHYDITIRHDGVDGWRTFQQQSFDLVILDLMLPGLDGLEICRRIRANESRFTPVLMLTSKSSELDRVLGLELGADDYLTKPFSLLEFIARVKALLRRSDAMAREQNNEISRQQLDFDGLAIDCNRREVKRDGTLLDLTAKEFDLLVHFASNPGQVYNRMQLLDQVWGYSHEGYEHTVNSHINRLRSKLEPNPRDPKYIKTVWGVGYQFITDPK